MRRRTLLGLLLAPAVTAALYPSLAAAQTTTLNGGSLALRSTNSNVINVNGYVGTYITLAAPGTVGLSVNAVASSGAAAAPHMNIVVDDSSAGFNVGTTSSNYSTN